MVTRITLQDGPTVATGTLLHDGRGATVRPSSVTSCDVEPSEALRRIAYLLEARRAETYKVRAFRRPRQPSTRSTTSSWRAWRRRVASPIFRVSATRRQG